MNEWIERAVRAELTANGMNDRPNDRPSESENRKLAILSARNLKIR